VLSATGQWRQALDFLARLEGGAHSEGRTGSLVEIFALQAIALYQLRETAEAFAAIERALALAEPGGYLRTFVDEGDAMQSLLLDSRAQYLARAPEEKHRSSSPLLSYTDKLLAAFPTPARVS